MDFEMEQETQPLSDWETQRAAMIAAEKEETVETTAANTETVEGVYIDTPVIDGALREKSNKLIERIKHYEERFIKLGATEHDLLKVHMHNTRHITDNIDQCSDEVLRRVLYMCTGKSCFADVSPHQPPSHPTIDWLTDNAAVIEKANTPLEDSTSQDGNNTLNSTQLHSYNSKKFVARLSKLGASVAEIKAVASFECQLDMKDVDTYTDEGLYNILYLVTNNPRFNINNLPHNPTPSKKPFQGKLVRSALYHKFGTAPIPYRSAIMSPIKNTVVKPAPNFNYANYAKNAPTIPNGIRDTSAKRGGGSSRARITKLMPKGIPNYIAAPTFPITPLPTTQNTTVKPKKVDLMEHVRAFADACWFDVVFHGSDKATPLKAADKSRALWLLNSEHDGEKYYPVAAIADADADIIKGWYSRCGIEFSIQKTPSTLELDGIDPVKTAPLNRMLSGEKGLTKREIPLFVAGLPEIVSHCKQERKMAECSKCSLSSIDRKSTHRITVNNSATATADVTMGETHFFKITPENVLLTTAERNMAATIAMIDEQNDTVFHTMYTLDCDARTKQTATFLKTLKTFNQRAYDKIIAIVDDITAFNVDLWILEVQDVKVPHYMLSVTPAITYRMRKLRETCEQIAKYDQATLRRYNLDGLIEGNSWRQDDNELYMGMNNNDIAWDDNNRRIRATSQIDWNISTVGPSRPIEFPLKLKTPRDSEQPMPWDAHAPIKKGLFVPETSSIDKALDEVIKSLFDENYVSISAITKTAGILRKSSDAPKTLTANLEAADKAAAASDKKPAAGGFTYTSFGGLDIDIDAIKNGGIIPNGDMIEQKLAECYRLPQPKDDILSPSSIEVRDNDDYHTAFDTTVGAAYPSVFDDLTQQNFPTLYDQLITDTRLTNAYPHLATSKTRIFNEKMAMETAKTTHIVMVMIHRATLSTIVETIDIPTGNIKELVDIQKAGGLARFAAPEYGFRKLFFYRTADDAIVAAIRTRFDGVAHFSDADIDRTMREILHVIDIQIHQAALSDAAANAADNSEADKMCAMIRNYVATAFDKPTMCTTLKSVASGVENGHSMLLLGLYRGNYKTDAESHTITVTVDDIFSDYLRSLNKTRPQNYLSVKKALVAAFVAAGWQHDAVEKTIAMTMTDEEMDTARVSIHSSKRAPDSWNERIRYNPNIPITKFENADILIRSPPPHDCVTDVTRCQSASWSNSTFSSGYYTLQ